MTASNFSLMAYNIIGTWAPRGQLEQNSKLFATMLASLRGNPQYEAAVGRWLANMGRIQQQGAIDRHRIWREAQEYISNSIQQTYQQNQVVQDRMAEQFGQTIHGVEDAAGLLVRQQAEFHTPSASCPTPLIRPPGC